MIVDGAPVALDGHKTSCGAVLIASQQATYKDMGAPPMQAAIAAATRLRLYSALMWLRKIT